MVQSSLNPFDADPLERRLSSFLEESALVRVLPVPTPLSKEGAARFLARNIPSARSAREMRTLARLAAFYGVTEVADLFVRRFGGLGHSDSLERWAAAICGASWVGGPQARSRIQGSVTELLSHADVLADRDVVYRMLESAWPDPADPRAAAVCMGRWLETGIARYDPRIEDARRYETQERARMLGTRKRTIAEFQVVRVRMLERLWAQQERVLALPTDEARIAALVTLAIDATPEGSDALRHWSSVMLLRLGGTTEPISLVSCKSGTVQPPETPESKARQKRREHIAAEFHKDAAARRDCIADENKRHDQDLYRARSLRAAYYFGHPGEPRDRVWLGLQRDPGTDILALRPDWDYPKAGTQN